MSKEVMGTEIVIDSGYPGYVFMGWAQGLRDAMEHEKERGLDHVPYFNIYVLSPVSSFRSDNYQASGFKAEKKKCLSAVWAENGEFKPGDRVRLFFDDKGNVTMAVIDG